MATVLILGSNSFAGATFSRTCLDAGFDVIGTSRSDQVPFHRRPYAWGQINRDIRFEKLDLNDDFEGVCSLVDAIRPEYVADFAAQGMVAPSWKHPEQWYQTNITAKVRLHNYLKDKDYLRCYLRISTPEVYGNTSGAVSPEHSLNPSTPYAVSHAAIDMSLMAFFRQYDFPVVFTRTANFYGPGQQLYRIVPRTMIYARTGRQLTLDGGGTSIRSFIYCEDFARAMFLAMTKGSPGECYHIANDEYLSIRDIVEKICDLTGVNFNDFVVVGEARPGLDQAYYLDTSKTRQELDWIPMIKAQEGFAKTLEWVDKHLDDMLRDQLEYIHQV